jgi:AAA domain
MSAQQWTPWTPGGEPPPGWEWVNGEGWKQTLAAKGKASIDKAEGKLNPFEVVMSTAASVVMVRTRWLWDDTIPMGELTIAAGREGAAKSQFSIWLAAQVTKGMLPGDLWGQARSVVICAKEDDWEKTIAPRLWTAQADMNRVHWIKMRHKESGKLISVSMPYDTDALAKKIAEHDVALVIFDPLMSFLSMAVDTHKAAEVRSAIEPIAEIGHDTGCSMLGLAHFAKTEGKDAASLISGSHAFKDVARSILVFAKDSDGCGVMSHVKSNLGPLPPDSMAYRVATHQLQVSDGWTQVPYFIPDGRTMRHVGDMLDTGKARAMAVARDFLRGRLSHGWRLSKEVEEEARMEGIASATLMRARKDAGVDVRKAPDGKWWMGFSN